MVNDKQVRPLQYLAPPLLFILAVPMLLPFLAPDIERADAMARGLAGPISWPRFALYGVLFCAVGWLIQAFRQMRRDAQTYRGHDPEPAVVEQGSAESAEWLIWAGLGLTLAYGFLIPKAGYPLATLAYFLCWLLLGGIRRPILVGAVALLGTVTILYVFVKLALMPLDRGQGMFDGLTVAIYRLLHIY